MTASPVSPLLHVPSEDDDFLEEEEEEELLLLPEETEIYFFATYPVLPPTVTLYQLPEVPLIVTLVPWRRTLTTSLVEDVDLRMFSELAVTVPVSDNAMTRGIRQRSTTRKMAESHFFTGKTPFYLNIHDHIIKKMLRCQQKF